jgi:hypothetical protein
MAIRYAMIRESKVQNICLWDGDTTTWQPPNDMTVIPAPDHVGVGWGYADGVWTEPVVEQVEE